MSKTKISSQLSLARTFRTATPYTGEAIRNFFSSLDSPLSLSCWLLYSSGEHQQLVEKEINPHHYNNSDAFRDDYTAVSFLSKATFLDLTIDKEAKALEKFFEFEDLCKSTNDRFRHPLSDRLQSGQNSALIHIMQRKIAGVLGSFRAEEFADSANWGPGASTLLGGEHVSDVNKYHSENGITRDLYEFCHPWIDLAYPTWGRRLKDGGFTMQKGNKIITVPKNSKIDRVIAIEPGLNQFFQKGIGSMIKRRLLRVGIDLSTQEKNAASARLGSKNPRICTVDFSSASDSIARSVVEAVMPQDWFSVMSLCRSGLGVRDSQVIRWEKFSSMGNGFTFELESLIFWAAASAVSEYVGPSPYGPEVAISVFGDDVIIDSHHYLTFSSFCEFLGFRVNPKKSFSSSYFRESCGAHWFDGSDCKPIFLKERLTNVQTVYKLANSVRNLAHRRCSYNGCDRRFRRSWIHLYNGVPRALRFAISRGYGDSGFVTNFDEATPVCARHGIEGFRVDALFDIGVNSDEFDGDGLLIARIRRGSEQEYGNHYTLRRRTRIKIQKLLVPHWYNLGSWI